MKKLIVSTDALKTALSKLKYVVVTKPRLPALLNIYFKVAKNKAALITSNLDITIFYTIDVECTEAFEFVLPFEFLSKVVALNAHCPISIEIDKVVKIVGPDDVYELNVLNQTADYPKIPELPKKQFIQLGAEIISTLQLALDTCNQNTFSKFSNVLLELSPGKITVASTDNSFHVFIKEFESDQQETEDILISPKVISVIAGVTELKLSYHKKSIGFECGNLTIVNTRSEEKYANYKSVFPPDWPPTVTAERRSIIDALNRCLLCNDPLHTATLKFDAAEVTFTATDDMINVHIKKPCNYTGTVDEISIDSTKLLTLLQQVSFDNISFGIHDRKRAIFLTSVEDTGYKGLFMPLR
jgi:DNA polymerase III sliding clamp (beta) subunit (PCNA family)